MNIDELKMRIENLRMLQEKLADLNYYIEEVESLCGDVGIEGSHHADMEYGRTQSAVEDALAEMEQKLSRLRVSI